ncbi:MAG: UDP-N-acetylmuramate dehydrogenase [Betaproteobacteria bacterium]
MTAPTPHFSLTALNTLRLSACAAQYWRVEKPEDLLELPPHRQRFILGGGSNVVLAGDFDGLVLHVALSGRFLAGEDADAWYVEAASGENWHDFVMWTLTMGWPGLENLALIPGTVGAAPVQNIGAYGLEAGELIHRLGAFDLALGEEVVFSREECRFAYRDSVFKQRGWHREGRMLITSVTFRLPKVWHPNLRYADIVRELQPVEGRTLTPAMLAEAVIAIRQRKLPDPAVLPNAGSFFENPIVARETADQLKVAYPALPCYAQRDGSVKLAAGWLIEQAGWKGRNLGPVGMYEKQALVLINRGGATGRDVLAMVTQVQADVERQFGIRLQPEPVFIGDTH